MLSGRRVVVGVTGGIACYKSCHLVRRLVDAGARVDVILTASAAEFVRPLTFEALSGRPVLTSLWEPGRALDHIRLARDADLVVVAPATANFLAKMAIGLADDFLTAVLLAREGPVLVAPAMNDAMHAAEATKRNLADLTSRGVRVVGPDTGALAEGPAERPGRMSEPEVIFEHAIRMLRGDGPLAGRRVVVTAGPTREGLDPVRVITNRSSGKMGYRLAEAAWRRGADVLLISGPSGERPPEGVVIRRIESTVELERAVAEALPEADVLVMAAAPADYRAREALQTKRPRQAGEVQVALEPTRDILSETRSLRKPGAVMVGFALETGDAEAKGRDKLGRKALDLIVINDANEPGAGFEVETNRVTILDREGGRWALPLAGKADVAEAILDRVEARLG